MKNVFLATLSVTFIFTLFLFSFLFVNLNQIKPVHAQAAPACTFSPDTVAIGGTITVTSLNHLTGEIRVAGGYWPQPATGSVKIGDLADNATITSLPISGTSDGSTPLPITAGAYAVRVGGYAVQCTTPSGGTSLSVTAAGGGGGSADIGTIEPGTLPSIPAGGESSFVANLVQASLSLLLLVAFVVDLIWTIIAGLRFITAGGDPKTVGSAWSQIYWGLIGMVVVIGSFAIIRLVETFFQVNIISGGFQLPSI